MELENIKNLSDTDAEDEGQGSEIAEFHTTYSLGQVIGQGGFGTVYSCIRNRDGATVAVKHVFRDKVQSWGKIGERIYPKEVCLLVHLAQNKGIIDLYDCFERDDSYLLVLEYPANCLDLFDFISYNGPLPDPAARQIFKQIIDTTLECEALGIVHRDIKDENILVNRDTLEIKIIDLGSGVFADEDNTIPFDGTGVYAPPELLLYREYNSSSCTVWSLGVLLYNMLVGDIPFHTFNQICESELTFPNTSVSQSAKDLIHECLQREPTTRIKLDNISTHPWILNV